jgi:hypothetical protein
MTNIQKVEYEDLKPAVLVIFRYGTEFIRRINLGIILLRSTILI